MHYVLDKPPLFWRGGSGFVSAEMLKAKMPAPGPDTAIYVCGPPGFMNAVSGGKAKDFTQGELDGAAHELHVHVCARRGVSAINRAPRRGAGHLKALGYTAQQVFKF